MRGFPCRPGDNSAQYDTHQRYALFRGHFWPLLRFPSSKTGRTAHLLRKLATQREGIKSHGCLSLSTERRHTADSPFGLARSDAGMSRNAGWQGDGKPICSTGVWPVADLAQ